MSTLKTNAITTTSGKPLLNSSGSVIQVVTNTYRDFWGGGAGSFAQVPGMNTTITPTSASSKILVLGSFHVTSGYWEVVGKLTKNGADIANAYAIPRGSRAVGSFVVNEYPGASVGYGAYSPSINYLDSPATTSAITYGLQMKSYSTSYNAGLNYNAYDDRDAFTYYGNGSSTFTLLEIA